MSGRSKRNVQSRVSKVSGVLADLQAAREGSKKRATTYEYKQEDAVFDHVDEDQYAQLVAKRRMEAGDFIEDDDGNYLDMGGEEEYWQHEGEGNEGEAGTKRKDGGAAPDERQAKRKPSDAPKDNKARERMQQMFAKAAARTAPAAGRASDQSSDALLEDILRGILPGGAANEAGTSGAGVSGGDHAAPGGLSRITPLRKTFLRPAAHTRQEQRHWGAAPAAHHGGNPFALGRVEEAAVPADAAGKCQQAAGMVAGSMRQVPASRPVGAVAAAPAEEEGDVRMDAAEVACADDFSFDVPGVACDDTGGMEDVKRLATASGSAPGMEPARGSSPSHADGSPGNAAVKREPADTSNSADAAGAQDVARPRNFSDAPAVGGVQAASAATGWHEVYSSLCNGSGAPKPDDGAECQHAACAPAAGTADGAAPTVAGLVLDAGGCLPFYLLDAYENPDRPDVLYLFGKVRSSSSGGGSGGWKSCCAVVPAPGHSVLVVPQQHVLADADGKLAQLEQEAASDPQQRMDLIKYLHERLTDVKAEVRVLLARHGVKSMRMVPVKRSYAFEDTSVPRGEQWVIKVRYPRGEGSPLPLGARGDTFTALFNAQQSALEALVLKRRIKGPGWLLLQAPTARTDGSMVSWCRSEVFLPAGHKAVFTPERPGPTRMAELSNQTAPPLTVASLSLKLHQEGGAGQAHEVLAASVVHLSGVAMDAPMARDEWSSPRVLRNFSLVRKLEGRPWPRGFEALVASENASPRGQANGGTMITLQANERALLTCLLSKLQALDVDVLVGHNMCAFDLSLLLHRMQHHKVPLWSRIGRLKRSVFPKLAGGGHIYGGGASPGVLTCLAGRLLCDTYLAARELVREVDYTLSTLAGSLLGQQRHDMAPGEAAARYAGGAEPLRQLLLHGESDAWLALGIMSTLSVLPLTKQLSNLSGSLWARALQGQRAGRIEMLLLHEFHARKFLLPPKLTQRERTALQEGKAKARGSGRRRAGGDGGGVHADDSDGDVQAPEDDGGDDAPSAPSGGASAAAGGGGGGGSKRAKGPQYAGGLVLEPKKGLYDTIVIMLDFNSLYPSIIQEYNICFTTVERAAEGVLPPLPESSATLAPLPTVIQTLVARRRQVKQMMAGCGDATQRQQLNIRQQALKLTANSMYGCLGFANSRFYAKPLAELITAQGRGILQSTVELVQGMGGLEVVYGDTDSLMIATGTTDLAAARALGASVKRAVNKRYRLLEIELDAVFRCMLLLKKKKYAAIKVEPAPGGGTVEVLEAKGLDIVRRDWCVLAKEVGHAALQHILSGSPKEEVVAAIHEQLRQVRAQVEGGQLPLASFVINKQLTKRPEEYADAHAQPHVQVALRRRAAGKRDGVMPGEAVPYVICTRTEPAGGAPAAAGNGAAAAPPSDGAAPQAPADAGAAAAVAAAAAAAAAPPPGTPTPAHLGAPARAAAKAPSALAARAHHPDELRSDPALCVDVAYYLTQQVHPVVARLCAPIEGTDSARLAECLGLDAAKYGLAGGGGGGGGHAADLREEALQVVGSLLDDDSHYVSCAPLSLTAPNGTRFDFAGVRAALRAGDPPEALLTPPDAVCDPCARLSAAQLSNQALLAARRCVAHYYAGDLTTDDELAPLVTRDVALRQQPGLPPGSALAPGAGVALLARVVPEDKVYTQLSFFARLLDVAAAVGTLPDKARREEARALLAPAAGALAAAAEAVATLRDAAGYRWVDLGGVWA